MMKKWLIVLCLLLSVGWPGAGQVQIQTKKFKIADFPLKTTKVVLTGNEWVDGVLQEAVLGQWTIAPFEFCTEAEFEKIKVYDDYYFLLFSERGNEGITFLTLVKGGPEAKQGIGSMLEVVSVPYEATEGLSVRSLIYLPALVEIMQDFVPQAIDTDFKGYTGVSSTASSLGSARKKTVWIAESDLANPSDAEKYRRGSLHIEEEDRVDDIFDAGGEGDLVSYTVNGKGTAYKMLIDAGTHKLQYYKKTKKPGFDAGELKKLAAGRK